MSLKNVKILFENQFKVQKAKIMKRANAVLRYISRMKSIAFRIIPTTKDIIKFTDIC